MVEPSPAHLSSSRMSLHGQTCSSTCTKARLTLRPWTHHSFFFIGRAGSPMTMPLCDLIDKVSYGTCTCSPVLARVLDPARTGVLSFQHVSPGAKGFASQDSSERTPCFWLQVLQVPRGPDVARGRISFIRPTANCPCL